MKRHNFFTKALIALGANVTSPAGPPIQTVLAGMEAIPSDSVYLRAKSHLYATPCVPAGAGPDYVNAAVCVETSLSAPDLLDHLHRIEADFARERTNRWGSRTLDLDIIDFDGQVLPDPKTFAYWRGLKPQLQMQLAPETLILPHPRAQDRAFVLVPLADVAPDWVHPVSGQPLTTLLDQLDSADRQAIRRIPDPEGDQHAPG